MGILSNIFGNKKIGADASVNFEVSMSCMNCVKHVKNFLSEEKGVVDFQIDLDSKKVKIEYNSNITNESKLQKGLEDLGFTVTK